MRPDTTPAGGRRLRLSALLVAAALLVAGCGLVDTDDTSTSGTGDGTTAGQDVGTPPPRVNDDPTDQSTDPTDDATDPTDDATDPTDEPADPGPLDRPSQPDDPGPGGPADALDDVEMPFDRVVDLFVTDIESWWASNYATEVGFLGGAPTPPDYRISSPGAMVCNGRPVPVEISGAFYCPPPDDYIAFEPGVWEAQVQRYGPFAFGWMMAHEWGHVIQLRSGMGWDAGIGPEAQADCLAGAYLAHLESGALPELVFGEVEQADVELFHDILGDDQPLDSPLAHGSTEFRLDHYRNGFENGAAACVVYAEPEGPEVTLTEPSPTTTPLVSFDDTGLVVRPHLEIVGLDGEVVDVVVYIHFLNGAAVTNTFGLAQYQTTDGDLATSTSVEVLHFRGTATPRLTIPYSQFPPGREDYCAVIQVTDSIGNLWLSHTTGTFWVQS